ncbi:GNAT family N-acetyltransferase [Sphingosinicella sp. BN140058]|uniref:GNAT family N-acetyltransferase n=1 Tax=Sphingosinicella sp. BN140058 TaxID=1892855 RepID=UPI0010124040|nr:GNAT family N-acetyltransferase [Sphingosinicella sp. BN140058]QAY79383.1 N-acetyltransferase [Sphingosinicella sp. BN140058]
MVPIVETARLRLRSFRESDLEAHARMLGDPDFVRHLGGKTFGREESWRRLLSGAGLWALVGYGYWAIERRSDNAFIGQVGFADFKRDLEPSIENMPEMGWVLAPETHGQGIASEAVAAALDWARRELPGREIVAIIDPANAPSIRVAEKAGFHSREEASYRGEPILLFRRAPD